jgi:hypothetical protein
MVSNNQQVRELRKYETAVADDPGADANDHSPLKTLLGTGEK